MLGSVFGSRGTIYRALFADYRAPRPRRSWHLAFSVIPTGAASFFRRANYARWLRSGRTSRPHTNLSKARETHPQLSPTEGAAFDSLCHPERSEGSAFSSCSAAPLALQKSFFAIINPAPRRPPVRRTGQLRIGTSGYSYKQWKGSFYPEKLPDKEMLSFYAKQFSTVEINHSFYRMPTESVLLGWAKSVPEGFRFALKANQQITHIKRLRDSESTLKRFLEVSSVLNDGDHLGPVLVQLPPNFKFDQPLLEEFLSLRPPAFQFAFEVRHASWYTEETYATLREHNVALCLAETEEQTPPDVLTADFAYVRLRKENYTSKELAAWKKRFDTWMSQGIDVFAYCKHEDEGKAPAYANQILGKK